MAVYSLSNSESSRSSSPERTHQNQSKNFSYTPRNRSTSPLLRHPTNNDSQRKKVNQVSSNLHLASGRNRHNNSHQRGRNWSDETEPRGRNRTPRSDNIHGVSVNANLRGLNSRDPQTKIQLKKVGSDSSDTAIKPYYIFKWNGHQYRLTHRQKEGNQMRQVGFSKKDWKALAEMQKTIWQAANIQNPEKSNFNVKKRILNVKNHGNEGEPLTIDFKTQSHAVQQTIDQALQSSYGKVKKHPLRFTNGNPPPPSFPGPKKKQKPAVSQDPINPLSSSVPPPEEIPWWRIDKRIANFFKKSPPQPAPQIINPPHHLNLSPPNLNPLNQTNLTSYHPAPPDVSSILNPQVVDTLNDGTV